MGTPVEGDQHHGRDKGERNEGQHGIHGQQHDENPAQSYEIANVPSIPLVKSSCRLPTSFWIRDMRPQWHCGRRRRDRAA